MPLLRQGDEEVTGDIEKARVLLRSFFPVPPPPQREEDASLKPALAKRKRSRIHDHTGKTVPARIDLPTLTPEEVKQAIMQAKADKVSGRDETTFRVWQELWPVIENVVVRLYRVSLELKCVPNS